MNSDSGSRPGYVPGLDGIRAIAIGLVLFSHSTIYGEFSHLRAIGHGAGYAGVAVFFVLSGYLITALLLREEDRTGGISLRLFYVRRALRLFPALWLYLLAVWALWLAGALPHHPWHSFVASLFYIRNLVGQGHETAHLWSLSIEEQFYILWPLVLVALPRWNRARFLLATVGLVGVTLWRVFAARAGLASDGALYIRSDFRFDAPLFGCALALADRVAPGAVRRWNATAARSAALAAVGAVGLIAWVGLRLGEAVQPGYESTVICPLGVVLVLSQVGTQGRGSRWLAWGPFVAVGQVSYGVYLWQQLFLGPPIPGFVEIRQFPLGLVATFVVAAVSYRHVELPLIRLKDRKYLISPRTEGAPHRPSEAATDSKTKGGGDAAGTDGTGIGIPS